MSRKLLLLSCCLILALASASPVMAQDWDNHKMHWPQLPDEEGWDVHVNNPMFLADDWTCSETGPITDIHWWGSWLDENTGVINEFRIKIWSNIPVDPPSIMYSRPFEMLWEFTAPAGSFTIVPLDPADPTSWEGWYDPSIPAENYPDHQQYFRYDLILPEQAWFDQVFGTIYWLSIEAIIEDDGTGARWGWKNSQNHHEDDAVYWDGDQWIEIYEPAEVLSNWFEIQIDPSGTWAGGYGVGNYILDPEDPFNGWYFYEEADPGWWNIWFYDHPLDYTRIKDIRIEYSVRPYTDLVPELYAEVTPNWATDVWSSQVPNPERPPLPSDFLDGTMESAYIGRGVPQTWQSQITAATYNLRIWDYNPEWVSVDVRGTNIWVEGTIYHTCRASLDLAFVITSDYAEPEGACCFPDPTGFGSILCVVTTATNCGQTLFGTYQGDGTVCGGSVEACCLPDGSCVMADTYCCTNDLGGTPQGTGSVCTALEACCFTDGTCRDLDPLCCIGLGGTPQGAGTDCSSVDCNPEPEGACCFTDPPSPDLYCAITTQTYCEQILGGAYQGDGTTCGGSIEACCLPDGSCIMADTYCCTHELGGTPQGTGSVCTALEACCFTDGTCRDLDPLCCIGLGGTPQGAGTDCTSVDCGQEPEGACCYTDPPSPDLYCVITTQTYCEQTLGGAYQGDYTTCGGSMEACCLPDGSCIMADTYCCTHELGGTPQGAGSVCTGTSACCMSDGACRMLDPLCCVDLGGTVQAGGGPCSSPEACCMADGSCQMLDPLCCIDLGGTPQGAQTSCTAPEACCFDDGSCRDLDPLCCVDLGGTPMGIGTNCATTVCEVAPEEPKNWYQPPDLSELGMDVNATWPYYVLADDFLCAKTEPITEIHIWGSWFNDVYPGGDPPTIAGDPGNVRFHLSIHADIPATQTEYSKPGEMLADWIIEPGEYGYKEIKLDGDYEGWFNPPAEWVPVGDQNCWEYIFEFDESNWFVQQGAETAPVIYWLDVQAIIPDGVAPALFGWKTSTTHWNDDAVWFDGEDVPQQLPWFEMRYPNGHPNETESVDQAFLIGGPCDCEPGEANGVPGITILDVVYIINYKYKEGPDPIPYALCSADPDCNCTVTILDVVYIINYKYKNGPPPCTCGNFLVNCPGGLR